MTGAQIKALLRDLLEQIDHDIAKGYDVETAEEPEFAEGAMADLQGIVKRHLKEAGL